MRVFDATTSTLTIGWDHAEGPVRQYRIAYAPMTGDPITEFVSDSFNLSVLIFGSSVSAAVQPEPQRLLISEAQKWLAEEIQLDLLR